ncbi:ATP-binding protein [Streptomyces milbemycinicus]|uniref:ATP-binding protein n=1 Tax=Streptomyces milbemycinicus TaxID=476552 RepID=UPI0033CE6CA6
MPESARYQYPTAPTSVSRARADCVTALADWGLNATDNAGAGEVLTIVGELMANAVTHGRVPGTYGRQVGFTLELTDVNLLRVEVRDAQSDRMPEKKHVRELDTHGRGLFLVDALSDTWGVRKEVIGKTVWAEKRVKSETEQSASRIAIATDGAARQPNAVDADHSWGDPGHAADGR